MRLRNHSLLDEVDDGNQGGGGDKKPLPNDEQIQLLTQSVGLLAQGLEKMEGNQTMILETLAKVTEQSTKQVKEQIEDKFGEDIDLETLDRKDFAKFLLGKITTNIQDEMKKALEGVDSKVQNLATSFESSKATEQIEKTAADNPDFWEWSAEIKALLNENPSLSVKRAYSLAKSENQKKATELDKKYNPPKNEKKEASFLGLTPTSSLSTRETGAVKMTPNEAAEKAFDKIMGDLGDVIQNGDLKIA